MKKIFCMLLAMMMVVGAISVLAEEAIVIGGIAPLSGPVSVYGIAVQKAVDMYVEEINAAGGVLGKQVKVEWLDDKHDQTEAVNAYNRLIDQKVSAILGPVTTAPTLAIVDQAGEDGIPLITATGTGDAITAVAYGNVYRACFKDSFQGKVMATFAANSLGAKKIAVIYDNTSDYSSGIDENFVKTCEELGVEVVANEACVAGSGDFKAQLTNIASKNPEALFVPMYYSDVSLIVQQAHEIGIEVPLLGVDGWDGIQDVMEDITLLNGYYFCNHSAADDTAPALVAFNEKFNAKYNEIPNTFAALGYDAANILLSAIEKAGSTDWAAIIEAMKATDLEGITGAIRYDEYGDPINKAGVINVIEDGQFKFYERVIP